MRVGVALTDETQISSPEGDDATLTNGQRVLVRGEWNTSTRKLDAETIRIMPNAPVDNPHRAFAGTIVRINSENEAFLLDLHEAGMRLGTGELRVLTTDTTEFRKVGRKNERTASFADLDTDMNVVVFGTLDAERRNVTATRVQILPNHR